MKHPNAQFKTEPPVDGEVLMSWSSDGENWDPLDFLWSPVDEVEKWKRKVREGFFDD